MCLHYILPKDKRKQILDKIDREGIKVYKVAEVLSGMYFPIFMGITPYRGTMIADTEDKIIVGSHHCHWDFYGNLKSIAQVSTSSRLKQRHKDFAMR